MDISVGIINYNTKHFLSACLESIAGQDNSLNSEIIVVDNASSDGSAQFVKNEYSKVRLIENDKNEGFARAVNKILKSTNSEFVLLLNPDTVLHERSIESMVDFMKRCPEAGAVGPLLINQDGSLYPTGRNFPSFFDAGMHAFLGSIMPGNRFTRRYKKLDWDRKSKKEVDWVSGAAICLRRKAVKEIDYFDERYFMYVEDMDLCYRLWENGWKVFLLPEAQVTHYIGKSSDQDRINMIREFQTSIYKFFKKRNKSSWKRFWLPWLKWDY